MATDSRITTHEVTVTDVTRLRNSRNGSPRYRLTTDSGFRFFTADDTADSYGWTESGMVGHVTVTLDAKGAVIGIDQAKATI